MECVLAHFGGNWNNGTNAGISYWNLNNSSSNTNLNIGRQTLIGKISFNTLHIPRPLAKIRPKDNNVFDDAKPSANMVGGFWIGGD